MRKYGIHWPLYFLSVLLITLPLILWFSQVWDVIWPPSLAEHQTPHLPQAVRWTFIALAQMVMMYVAARENAKQKAKAAQAAERTPIAVKEQPAPVMLPTNSPARLRKMFGVVSAVVGIVTVAAYFMSGKIGMTQLIAYPLLIPLLTTAGAYLAMKAQQPEPREEVSAARSPETTLDTTPRVTLPTEQTAPVATLRRR